MGNVSVNQFWDVVHFASRHIPSDHWRSINKICWVRFGAYRTPAARRLHVVILNQLSVNDAIE